MKKVSIIFKNNSYHIKNPRRFDEIMCNLGALENLIGKSEIKRNEYKTIQSGRANINICPECSGEAKKIENGFDLHAFQDDVFNHGIYLGKAIALRWIIGEEWEEIEKKLNGEGAV